MRDRNFSHNHINVASGNDIKVPASAWALILHSPPAIIITSIVVALLLGGLAYTIIVFWWIAKWVIPGVVVLLIGLGVASLVIKFRNHVRRDNARTKADISFHDQQKLRNPIIPVSESLAFIWDETTKKYLPHNARQISENRSFGSPGSPQSADDQYPAIPQSAVAARLEEELNGH